MGRLKKYKSGKKNAKPGIKGQRETYFEKKGFLSVPVYDGEKIIPDEEITGPAIVEYSTTTLVILPGQVAIWDEWLNAVIKEV